MAPYEYSKLDVQNDEIRILKLLPSEFDDPLQGLIQHVSLRIPEEKVDARIPMEELEKTMPDEWGVMQTIEGRYIFYHEDGHTSWKHPGPNFDHSCYQGYDNDANASYEPKYEALSYVWSESLLLNMT
jgi:hypothetical protein